MSGSQEINNNDTNYNNITLSKGAINYLDNQFVQDGDNKIIEAKFIFQIIYVVKNLSNWYCCSLLDQNSKFGGFCIKYESIYGEPKEGDIIQTQTIKIVKLPNRDTNLYFCENVKRLSQSKKMKIEPNKVDSVSKKRSSSKKDYSNMKKKFLDYISGNDIKVSEKKDNSVKKSDIKENINNEKYNLILNQKKYTLISCLNSFINNPFFLLKCKSKSGLRDYKNSRTEGQVQNYLFIDTEGSQIQAVSFNANYHDDIINVGSIYEIYRAHVTYISRDYDSANCPFQLIFQSFTRVKEVEDDGKFDNVKDDMDVISIQNLTIEKLKKVVNIVGIVLENKGIIEKLKENHDICKFRSLIIGDDTLHRINIKLWSQNLYEKEFSKGDIILITNIKFKEYFNTYQLSSLIFTEVILYNDNRRRENELKNFYIKHPNLNEYTDISYSILYSNPLIEYKFIYDYRDNYNIDYLENNNRKLFKISGYIYNIFHGENNLYLGCFYCNKKFEEMCPNCLTEKTKLIMTLHILLMDCSDYLWIELYDEIAEDFFGVSPHYYEKIIKENKKEELEKINKKLLYHHYSFIGRYKGPSLDDRHGGIFQVIQYNEINNKYYNDLLNQIK